ncbi:MAG: prepilin-type N-terminal cleavage/methylation domain-containing protein [Gammaproteobacteria bacterium]|nr:prepilin-type N-terminal cleavage/methylation domain-containing protein [Gammaproteobacteria bacterium]
MNDIHSKTLVCRQSGFTLIELIIALTLSSMVLVLLAGGMNVVLKDWERSGSRLEDNLDNALGLLQIERAFQGAFPHLYLEKDKNKKYIYFEGEDKEVTWVSTVSPGRETGLTAWKLKRGKDGKGLDAYLVPAFAGNPEKNLKKTDPIALFENYKAYFEYLEVDERKRGDSKEKVKWQKEWSGKERQSLPYAVRLRLEKSGKNPLPPVEIVALILAREHATLRPKRVK